MLKGIHLTLLVGPLLPTPVPREVIEAMTELSVHMNDDGTSGFQISFQVSNKSPLQTIFLIASGSLPPIIRVIAVVTVNGSRDVIMDGVITNCESTPAANGQVVLTVTGEDLTVLMNRQDFSGFPFPAAPAEARVALLIAKYSFLGLIPKVIPSVMIDVPIPTTRIPAQKGTDLQYIRELGRKVGYVFYIEPGPSVGMNLAYWGPQIKFGAVQPALNTNSDGHTNLESLSFSFNSNQSTIPTVYNYNESTKTTITIPIPPVSPLSPPLGFFPPIATKLEPVSDELSKYSLPKAIMIGMAKVAQSADAVTGTGELNVLRYGRVLKSRQLVGVRGAGMAYDGLYYVKKVTHRIKRGEYKQGFELTRNGLVSTLPRLPV